MPLPKNNKLLPRARELRKDMTQHERKLWYLFLRRYPVKIYKQRIINNFIVDFYCYEAKLVIEVDGTQHYMEKAAARDLERDQALKNLGLFVLRFSNYEIDAQFDSVCEQIDLTIRERTTGFCDK